MTGLGWIWQNRRLQDASRFHLHLRGHVKTEQRREEPDLLVPALQGHARPIPLHSGTFCNDRIWTGSCLEFAFAHPAKVFIDISGSRDLATVSHLALEPWCHVADSPGKHRIAWNSSGRIDQKIQ